jgi:hypothetical protein
MGYKIGEVWVADGTAWQAPAFDDDRTLRSPPSWIEDRTTLAAGVTNW